MADEIVQEVVEETAGVQEAEDRVDAVDLLPDTGEDSELTVESGDDNEELTPEKTFTQEELDEIVAKRLARERRKTEREHQAAAEIPMQFESRLNPDDFETTDEYIEALADERADAKIAHREQTTSINTIQAKYEDQVDQVVEKYPDFIQVAHQHNFMTQEMATAIKDSGVGAEMAYHLGSNLGEAERIFKLPPIQQIKELGKLEAKLETAEPEKRVVSEAPAPLNPVESNKSNTPKHDTTDPRSAKQMTASEWIAADRKRRGYTS